MSKSNLPFRGNSEIKVLLFEFGTPAAGVRVPAHCHPFWQFEMIRRGRAECFLPGEKLCMSPGDLLFIPPSVVHGFSYISEHCEYISTKFVMSGGFPAQIPSGLLPGSLAARVIRQALPVLAKTPAPLASVHGVLRHLLRALMLDMSESTQEREIGDFWSGRVRRFVAEQMGAKVTVASLAKRLGVSAGYLSARFRAAEGQSLKAYLDGERVRRAVDLLCYSDLQAGQIAEALGFPDPFTFSRFVRKHTGVSPRELLQKKRP